MEASVIHGEQSLQLRSRNCCRLRGPDMCWEEARGLPGSLGPKAWEVEPGALMGACCPAPRASPRHPGSPGPVARTRPWGSWVAEPLVPGQGCAGAWRQPGENGLARAAQAPSGGPNDQGLVRRTAWFIPPPRQLLPEHSLYRHLRRGGSGLTAAMRTCLGHQAQMGRMFKPQGRRAGRK